MNPLKLQTSSSTEETLELISFFIYEFNSQLNSIVADASLLNNELNFYKGDSRAEIINDIIFAACDIQKQLKKLIELAKSKTAGFQIEVEIVDVNYVIAEVLQKLTPIIRSKNQKISKELNPQLPNIHGDSLRIEQVLLNLLSNASLNTPDGGHISLIAGLYDESVFIRIQDSGPLIPVKMHRHIFQPFCDLLNPDKDCVQADLNLALCKHYIDLHGGKIVIENTDNKGNAYSIILPSAE